MCRASGAWHVVKTRAAAGSDLRYASDTLPSATSFSSDEVMPEP